MISVIGLLIAATVPYDCENCYNTLSNLTAEQNLTICKLLKGLNFRQISAVIDKDELIVVKILYPSILNKTIIVRDPKSPFDINRIQTRPNSIRCRNAQS